MCVDEGECITDDSDDSGSDVSMLDSDSSDMENEDGSSSPTAVQHTSGDNASNKNEEEEEEEDELVKAIIQEKQRVREHPPDIQCDDYVVDLCFHPQKDILAAATICGDVVFYKYTNENTSVINTAELHMKACRDIEFSDDGSTLFSSSKDLSIVSYDVEKDKFKNVYENAHEHPIYCMLVMDENLIASGDDEGTVKLWDLRKKDPIFSIKETDDFVSCMLTTEAQRYLLCSSGDGTLTSINIGSRKLHLQSEPYDAELTSMALVRSDTKVVTGSSKGKMYLFNWGEFGYHSDEFPGPKQAINMLIPITENIVITGCEDGLIRATHLFPHRHLGIVGQHQFSIESMDISNDGYLISSFSHDNTIKFWNIKYFEDVEVNEKEKSKKRKDMSHNLPSSKYKNPSDFFSGLV
ncbi:WD repeat-containing protein 55 homolog isoform X2 [Anabrus simplex]